MRSSVIYFRLIGMVCIATISCTSPSKSLNDIIDPATRPVMLNTDTTFTFTEGPVYDARGILYFTDGTTGKVFRMTKENKFQQVITGAGRPDGMMIDQEGNLVVCDYDAKKLDLYSSEGKFLMTISDSYNGKGLNGPNDVVIDKAGGIYFTDPFFRKPGAPQDAEGVYYIPRGGEIRRICDHLSVPNGIILTPDEKTLLIVDTQEPEIHAIDILSTGEFGNHREWGRVTLAPFKDGENKPRSGSVGVAMDRLGNLYVATDLGLEIFNSKGQSLGVIRFNEFKRPMNMTFGRNDPYTIIITAYGSVFSVKTSVKGISFPQMN